MKKVLILIFSFFVFSISSSQKISAAPIVLKESSRIYTVNNDFVEVSESKKITITQDNMYIAPSNEEVFTLFNPVQNDTERDLKLQKTKDSIQISDNLGSNLQYITDLTQAGNIILKVKYPVRIDSLRAYTLYLKYSSYGLLVKNAKLRDIFIPSFSSDYKFETETTTESVTTKVVIPKEYGEINFITVDNSKSFENNSNVINLSKESLVGETARIQVGTEQFYSFKISQPFESTSSADFFNNKYKVLIPRDIESGPITQKVFFSEISPKPSNSYYDENRNLFLEFSIPANQSGNIIVKGFTILKQNNAVDYKNSGTLSQIPKDIVQNNTGSAKYWESENEKIKEVANLLKNQVKGEDKNVYALISNTYKYVIDKIDYSEVKRFGINDRQGALATLEGGAAVCMEYSDLFITLMRAQGVPARGAFGYGYSALDSNDNEQTINHQWAEVYIPNLKQWVSVDTTWGENGQELIGGDLNHFYTHVASVSPEIPATSEVEFYGYLNKIESKDINVKALETLPDDIGNTGEEIFQKYKNDQTRNAFEELIIRVRLFFYEADNSINILIKNNFKNIDEVGITYIKLIPIVIISIILLYFIFKKIQRNKQKLKF